jgi:hypothetical protein
MSDPRYKNGIKKNTAIHLERPVDYGWQRLGVNPETNRTEYSQDGCRLVRPFGPGYFVQNRNGVQYHITGATLAEVTAFILADPHAPVVCIKCNNVFDSRLPDTPEPMSPLCDMCVRESIVNVPLAA